MIEDKLTGLQDRVAFISRLKMHCERAITMGHRLGLLVIDLNRFHRINDWFGFRVGDDALRHAATLIKSVARKRDLVARIGGNQFAMILPGIMNEGHAVLAASKLSRLLEEPIHLAGHKVVLSASTGIALSPEHSTNFDRLFAKAERAMRDARLQEAPFAVCQTLEDEDDDDALLMEFELESAFASGHLQVYFQPKMDMKKEEPVGAEALMRWHNGMRGFVSPEIFIPAGERARLINNMTQWTINSALQFASEWTNRFGQLSVAVNLSPAVLADPNLADNIECCLGVWQVPSGSLILEVTESSALAEPAESFKTFEALAELGVRISLDDFGTGYSSLAHFRNIPAHELKLDRTFVQHITQDMADWKIAAHVIELAHSFDMQVTAEGVESYDAFDTLRNMGCDFAQGFYVAKPMPHAAFRQWLKEYQSLDDSAAGPTKR
ncbi:MAG: bifunctional diguanylate cyclase/phosphodiesterase [Pseudomonadota bacterium]